MGVWRITLNKNGRYSTQWFSVCGPEDTWEQQYEREQNHWLRRGYYITEAKLLNLNTTQAQGEEVYV